jgi:two-component system, LuxR family, response regulator FixJ
MTVHVIDDDDAMRESLEFLLGVRGFEVRLYESALAFLEAAAEAPGDCILSDIGMPGMSGMELVRALADRGSTTPVVLMTGQGDVPIAVEAMKAGVVDFIEKPFLDDVLLAALQAALDRAHQPDGGDAERRAVVDRFSILSPRERDVLSGVVAGKANKVIAHELGISPRTVEIYRANLMAKTGARNLPELMRMALAAGL